MSEKITLTPDQIVSRKSGWVQYIDSNGTQRKIRSSLVAISEESDEAVAEGEGDTAPPQMSPTLEQAVDQDAGKTDEERIVSKAKSKRAVKTNGQAVRSIGGKTFDLSRYERTKAPGGGVSYHNGDEVANLLNGKDLDAVYKTVAAKTKTEENDLRKKYKHLNAGMQRMNLGNRLRKVLIPKAAR